MAARSARAARVRRYLSSFPSAMLLPHVRLERLKVEVLGGPALQPLSDKSLYGGDLGGALLVTADEVAHIVAGVAVAPAPALLLDPLLHRIGQRYVHGSHGSTSSEIS